jgi:tetratricopeptide (TPR) repeat protein
MLAALSVLAAEQKVKTSVLRDVPSSVKVFVQEYTYQASEYDSKVSCRAIAFEQAKRLVLEKLGTYVESETEVRNFQLTQDRIVTLAAGVVSTEIIDEKWNGNTYYLKARIMADPKEVAESIDKLRQDRRKTKELEETRKIANGALREIETLKKELEIAKANKAQFVRYNEAVNTLAATVWVDKGLALARTGRRQEAIERFSKAIELDPKLAIAYNNRGTAYLELGNDQRALMDYDRAIELDPNYAPAYAGRAGAYGNLGNHQQALRDCDRAIELDPKIAMAYSNRGMAHAELGNYQQALRDCDRAIELDPQLELTYVHRAFTYIKLRNYHQALLDSDRAIQLDPKDADAYANRGVAYLNLGNSQQAIEDFKVAARLGFTKAQDYLRKQGIAW